MKDVAVVYIVDPSEDNHVVKETYVSAKSLRSHGGKYKDSPIYFIMPSEKPYDSDYTKFLLKLFKIPNSKKIIKPMVSLDKCLQTDGFINKAAGMKFASENFENKSLLYVDCDTLFLNEPPFDLLENQFVYTYTQEDKSYGEYLDGVFKISDELFKLFVSRRPKYIHTFGWFIYTSRGSEYWKDYYSKYYDYSESIKELDIKNMKTAKYLDVLGVEEDKKFNFLCALLDEVVFSELRIKYKCKQIPGAAQDFNIDDDTWIFHFDDIPSAINELRKTGKEGKLLCLL